MIKIKTNTCTIKAIFEEDVYKYYSEIFKYNTLTMYDKLRLVGTYLWRTQKKGMTSCQKPSRKRGL